MRLLHTADWHVGRTIRGRHRGDEHQAALQEVAAIARAELVDIVLVGGDLFDTASPSPEAERVVYRALLDLASTGATVVVIPGNHDNDRRLAAVAPLFGLGQVQIQPFVVAPADGGVIELETKDAEKTRIALLPFLSQRYAVRAGDLMAGGAGDHAVKYADRVRAIVGALTAPFAPDAVNIVLSHLTVTGGVQGGGERQAQTVFDYWVDPTAFPPTCHYVALGHLHKAQHILGPCPIWYCGSLLQLDFGEAGKTNSVLLVDVTLDTPAKVREVPLTSGTSLRTLRGTLPELTALSGTTGDDYLRVFVNEKSRIGLADEVRELFPEVVDIIIDSGQQTELRTHRARTGRSPLELFAEYLEEKNVADKRLQKMFAELYEEADAAASA